MSNKDFRSGFNVTELDQEEAEKAERIHEAMKEANNNRLSSKAATGRAAIHLAAEFLDMLEEEVEDSKRETRDLMDFRRNVLRRVQE